MLSKKALLGSITALVLLFAATVAMAANITGTPGPDTLNGTAAADNIDGLAGDDRITGLGGADVLRGSDGNDTISGDGVCPTGTTSGDSPYYCIPGPSGRDQIDRKSHV